MLKFKVFKNVKKEEEWLNSMALAGFVLKYYSENYCFYIFEKGVQERLEYKCDFRCIEENDIVGYKRHFEEFEWKYIKHNITAGKHIFYRDIDAISSDYELFHEIQLSDEQRRQKLRINISYTLLCLFAVLASIVCRTFYLNDRSPYLYIVFNTIILIFVVFLCMNVLKTILTLKKQ